MDTDGGGTRGAAGGVRVVPKSMSEPSEITWLGKCNQITV
jgi:hypothetical protein